MALPPVCPCESIILPSLQRLVFTRQGSGMWQGNAGGMAENIFADINGDGRTDLIRYIGSGTWQISLSTGKNFITSNWTGGHTGGLSNNIAADLNGDGKIDLAAYLGNGAWQVSLSTGNGFQTSNWSTSPSAVNYVKKYSFDYNGDGKTDIIARGATGLWDIYISTGTGFQRISKDGGFNGGTGTDIIGNFTSDTRTDLATYKNGRTWNVATPNQVGFYYQNQTVNEGDANNTMAADVNGDGLTDLLRYQSGTDWKISLSKGNGSFNNITVPLYAAGPSAFISGDWNMDGYQDMARYNGSNLWDVYFFAGNRYTNAGNWTGHAGGTSNNAVVDLDGNGAADLITYNSGNSWTVRAFKRGEGSCAKRPDGKRCGCPAFLFTPYRFNCLHQG